MSSRSRPVLCLVTAPQDGPPGTLAARVGAAAAAGVDWVQVRDRALEGGELLSLVRAIGAAAPGLRVIVNRRVDVALSADAGGAHLGFDAMSALEARQLLGSGARIGASCHSVEEVLRADPALDYVHLAPIFDPISKPAHRPPLGFEALKQASAAGLPVLAQGGITAANARACIEAGAAGVAVTGEILGAADPASAARSLREALCG